MYFGMQSVPEGCRPAPVLRRVPPFALAALLAGSLLPLSAGAGRVVALRHFSTRGYTRVVLVMDRESLDFRTGRLKNPPRIFVDIPSGRLKTGFRLPSFEKTSLAQKLR